MHGSKIQLRNETLLNLQMYQWRRSLTYNHAEDKVVIVNYSSSCVYVAPR